MVHVDLWWKWLRNGGKMDRVENVRVCVWVTWLMGPLRMLVVANELKADL